MNYASKILDYLTHEDRFSQVLMIAGAPAVEKTDHDVRIVLNTILTSDDIQDTLATFASHGRRRSSNQIDSHGVFAFGIPNRGRFRVHYLTQRGSLSLTIQRMAFDVPKLEDILDDPEQLAEADTLFHPDHSGIILLTGPASTPIIRFIYSMLARINDRSRIVICIVEQQLSYSLRHRNSIVAQIEAEFDVPTLAEGIRSSLYLCPDLLYVRDCRTREDLDGLICAVEAGALVITSAVAFNNIHFLSDVKLRLHDDYDRFSHLLLPGGEVTASREGKVCFHPKPAGESSLKKGVRR